MNSERRTAITKLSHTEKNKNTDEKEEEETSITGTDP
ncbi:hypothetical protein SOVF_145440 [Spinacia oleracea]|nr:hypothetical protein SOVF_145440 [Spinacia oleracea]